MKPVLKTLLHRYQTAVLITRIVDNHSLLAKRIVEDHEMFNEDLSLTDTIWFFEKAYHMAQKHRFNIGEENRDRFAS